MDIPAPDRSALTDLELACLHPSAFLFIYSVYVTIEMMPIMLHRAYMSMSQCKCEDFLVVTRAESTYTSP